MPGWLRLELVAGFVGMRRQGRIYPGKKTWGARHTQWLQAQRFDHLGQHLVLQELLLAARHAGEQLDRIVSLR
jgi:hypothetical protein